jgi:NAD(P)-dependent dehydrogenase (short-subunit alcohol dehydrogenase family)
MTIYKDQFSLGGKVAVVTGGAGILGKRFCSGFAEFGARVAVVDLDAKAAADFAQTLRSKYDTEAIGVACDVADPKSVGDMVSAVVGRLGGIDILHNNAATKSSDLSAFFAPYEEYSYEIWREVMAVNIDGMFLVSQAVGRQMQRQKRGGSIIQTSSIYGILGPDKRIYEGSHYLGREINTPAVYSVSKAAILGLTRHLATTWAEHGIRVNAVTFGGIESGQNDTFQKRYADRVPLRRMGRADEVVSAVLFLGSDASSYVTGQNLVIDGGLSAW